MFFPQQNVQKKNKSTQISGVKLAWKLRETAEQRWILIFEIYVYIKVETYSKNGKYFWEKENFF